ncbi:undecaprenyl-diphosphate phosphatase [Anaerolineales bacterium]
MEEWIKVIILGIVQGITEFLPISSTGHLIVSARLLALDPALLGSFEIFIQIGSVVAVLLFYWKDLLSQARHVRSDMSVRRFWLAILIAIIPAGLIGFLFDDFIESVLYSPMVVAIALIIGGIVFIIVEQYKKTHPNEDEIMELTDIRWQQALTIGLIQVLALIPGTSRSGTSILGGLLSGLDRRTATQFSFYMAIPLLGAATVYTFLKSINGLTSEYIALFLLGAVVSGIVSWFAISWLLRFISRYTFISFGVYRIIIGLIILVLIALQLVN